MVMRRKTTSTGVEAAEAPGPGYWQASDGKWYPPEQAVENRADHYEAVVNKKDVNMRSLTSMLNARWHAGWKLAHMIEQHGNTLMVFERR